MGCKKLWGTDCVIKMILLSIGLITVGTLYLIGGSFSNEKTYDYTSTDFIEPDEEFVLCDSEDDCFKFRGSACPAEAGGVEVCVNKNFVQEYSSEIEGKVGLQIEIECPQADMSTRMECGCVENKCTLVGESA